MKFRTPYDIDPYLDERQGAPVGSRYMDKFQVKVDEFGNRSLEKTGETDLDAVIQSFKAEVDFKDLLARCTRSGDFTPLQQVQGSYFDGTVLPSDLRGLFELDRNARSVYENSSELQERYKSYSELLKGISTDEGVRSLFSSLKSAADVPVASKEVSINES